MAVILAPFGISAVHAADQTKRVYPMPKFIVADLDKSLAFYTKAFGLKEAWRYSPAANVIGEAFLTFEGSEAGDGIILFCLKSDGKPIDADSGGSLVLVVPDMDAAVKRATDAGGALRQPPGQLKPPGKTPYSLIRFAHFKDPDGYTIELVQFIK